MIGVGCRVGPGRGAGLSAGPFPWPALRTRRARLHAPGSPPVHVVALFVACRVVLAQGEGMRAPR